MTGEVSGRLERALVRRLFGVLVLGCAVLMGARVLVTGSAIGGDAAYQFAAIRSLGVDRDLDLADEYERLHRMRSRFTGRPKLEAVPAPNPRTGRAPLGYPLGEAVAYLPFFLAAHGMANALEAAGLPVETSGYGLIHQLALGAAGVFYGVLAVGLIYWLGERLYGAWIAALGAAAIWLAGPLVYYMTMEPVKEHALSAAVVAGFVALWLSTRGRRRPAHWLALGALGGLMAIVRYQDALLGVLPLLDEALLQLRRGTAGRWRRLVGGVFLFVFAAAPLLSLQLVANHVVFGHPLATGYGAAGFPYLGQPWLAYTLFSADCGLLRWHPVHALALAGLLLHRRPDRQSRGLLWLAFLSQWYLISAWAVPSQGDSFGNRMLLNLTVVFALGLMALLARWVTSPQRLRAAAALLAVLVVGNGVVAALYCLRVVGNPY